MYFVEDGTNLAGFYDCQECGYRFLSRNVGPSIVCPNCGENPDMEIGPDDEMPKIMESAKLVKVLRDDEVEQYDTLLSLALTGGDPDDWI